MISLSLHLCSCPDLIYFVLRGKQQRSAHSPAVDTSPPFPDLGIKSIFGHFWYTSKSEQSTFRFRIAKCLRSHKIYSFVRRDLPIQSPDHFILHIILWRFILANRIFIPDCQILRSNPKSVKWPSSSPSSLAAPLRRPSELASWPLY